MIINPLRVGKWLPLGLALVAPGGFAETQILDSVVAIVEDDVIMSSEMRNRMQLLEGNLRAAGREPPAAEIMVRETLDRLILESIQMQKGRRAGVRISDAQLNSALSRIAAQSSMDLEQFRLQLEQQGQSYQAMRETVRRELIIQRVQAGNVNQRIQISDEEIDNFLESEEGRQLSAEEYHLIHALLPVAADVSTSEEAAISAHVDQLYRRISGGESFEEVVSGSSGQYTFQGGDLGRRKRDDLPSLFAEVAPQLEVNQTSAPIRSPSGYHLIFLAEKRGGSTIIRQSRVRHILLQPSAIRTDEETRALATELRAEILAGSDFAALAREHSEDIGSAREGGDLGWTSPGQMVPEFENIMDSSAPGDVSRPFRSQFGWHVLQLMERRKQDVSDTVVRNRAGELLYQRKYQEELDAWLRKIRDEAFVDIK